MSKWLEGGRSTLLRTLNDACDQIDAHVQTELDERRKRELELSAEIESLRSRVTEVDRLQLENQTLKTELLQLRANNQIGGQLKSYRQVATEADQENGLKSPRPAKGFGQRLPLADVSPNKSLGPVSAELNRVSRDKPSKGELSDIDRDRSKLEAKYAAVLKSRDQERLVFKKRKEECVQWANYADSLEKKIKRLELKLSVQRDDGLSLPPDQHALNPAAEVTEPTTVETSTKPDLKSSFSSTANPATPSRDGDGTRYSISVSPRRAIAVSVQDTKAVCNTTEISNDLPDETQGEPATADELHPELPEQHMSLSTAEDVHTKEEVSSDGPVFISERSIRKRKRNEPDRPTLDIKAESSGSDPVVVGESHHSSSGHESLDLDAANRDIRTPKKRRNVSRPDQDDQEVDRPGPVHYQSAVPRTESDAVVVSSDNSSSLGRHASTYATVLARIPANIRQPRTSPKAERKFQALSKLDLGIKDLAEDGDDRVDDPEQPPQGRPPVASGRIDALLNTPSPRSVPEILRSKHRDLRSLSYENEPPKRRALPFTDREDDEIAPTVEQATRLQRSGDQKRTGARGRDKANTVTRARDRRSLGDERKLRDRPLSGLVLEDFKINPNFNEGHDFAFNEVVRGKGRDTLLGCVDPQCCGKVFRSLALVERKAIGPSVNTRAEDIKLLESHLGDDAYRLGSMSKEEKEDLWLEAKTRVLSNKYGKHRHRYARRPSPPGFWNADWPSTQEQQQDKEEAERTEKALVQERYRDAMRGGGRWLFRDE